jgi:cytochrome d ubiquinol oxidase subunit I
MTFSGWLALLAGWYTTEIGRQPWLVYGVLQTARAAAPNVGSGMIGTSLAIYLSLYILLITAFVSVVFYLARHAGDALDRQGFSYAAVPGATSKNRGEEGE